MKIIKFIKKWIHTFLINLLKEDDYEDDFRRNFSVNYTLSSKNRRKFI